jgi:DNA-binding transcriptional ArsR family regulator
MPNRAVRLDPVFRALSDPTRRQVIRRLGQGPATTTDLAADARMALPSFLQHLDVLETAKLVRSRKAGRVRTFVLTPEPLREAERWILDQRAMWESRLDQLDNYLLNLHRNTK